MAARSSAFSCGDSVNCYNLPLKWSPIASHLPCLGVHAKCLAAVLDLTEVRDAVAHEIQQGVQEGGVGVCFVLLEFERLQ
jgi:hypothetical protein